MACTDTPRSRKSQGSRVPRTAMATVVDELCRDQVFTATTLEANGWDEYVLTGEDFEFDGPAIVDIVIHPEGTGFTSNFKYDVVLQYRGETGGWLTASPNLITARTDPTYVIGTVFNDRTKLGIHIRIVLRTTVATGSSVTQKGTMTIHAAVRYNVGC